MKKSSVTMWASSISLAFFAALVLSTRIATATDSSIEPPAITVRFDDLNLVDFPERRSSSVEITESLRRALGIEPLEVLADEMNYLALLPDAQHVRTFRPSLADIAALDRKGLIVTAAGDNHFDFVSRYFTPQQGVPEDSVTGSAHCALTPYWSKRLGKQQLRAYQASSRGGEIRCRHRAGRVELRGTCVFYLEGAAEI